MDRLVVIVCDEDSNCFGYAEWFCSWINDTTSNWPIIFEFNGKLLHFNHLFYYPKSSEVVRACKIIVKNREEAEKEIEKFSQDNRWTNIFKVKNEVPNIPTVKSTIHDAAQSLYQSINHELVTVCKKENSLLLLVNSDVDKNNIINNFLSNGKYLGYDVEIEVGYSFLTGSKQ